MTLGRDFRQTVVQPLADTLARGPILLPADWSGLELDFRCWSMNETVLKECRDLRLRPLRQANLVRLTLEPFDTASSAEPRRERELSLIFVGNAGSLVPHL